MSLKLTHRLDKIENEIRYMLMLQKCGSANEITVTEATPTPTESDYDSKPKHILTKIHSKRQLPPSSRCTFQTCDKFVEKSTTRLQRSTVQLSPAKCCSEITRPVTDPYQPSKSNLACYCASTIIGKPKPKPKPFGLCTPECRPMCKCGITPLMELEFEQAKRRRLEQEVEQLKSQLCALSQSKSMAITMTKQLKKKYEKVRNSFDESSTKMQTLTKENNLLCKCLQQERQRNIVRAKGDISSQKCDDSCICKGSGLETIQERDQKIKTLNESVISLTKSVQEKEQEKKKAEQEKQKIEQDKQKIEQKLQQHKDVTKKLSETNSKLSKSVKSKHESFMALKNKTSKYEKQLDDYKSSLRKSQQEIETLKREHIEKEKKDAREKALAAKSPERKSSIGDLSEKLKKTKDRERKSSEMIQVLSQKLRDAEDKSNKEAEREINRLRAECKTLQAKLEETNQKLKDCQAAEAKKTEAVKKEIANVAQNLNKNSDAITEDKGKLNAMIAELEAALEDQLLRLAELEALRQQQDIVIKSQNEQLMSKDEEIRLQEEENAIMREKCLLVGKTPEQMKSSGDMTEGSLTQSIDTDKIRELEAKIDELLSALEMERQKVSELEKLIEDQNKQLDSLKTAQAELQKAEDKLHRTSRELEKQQELTQETAVKIEKMQTTKVRLQGKMDQLETMCSKLLHQKDESLNRVIELEGQLEDEKSIRVELCQRLEDEKREALDIAKYARRTLIETVNDYQSHMVSQMNVQRVIYDIMKSKSRKRKPGCPPERGKGTQTLQTAVAASVDNFTTASSRSNTAADMSSSSSSRRPDSAPLPRAQLRREGSYLQHQQYTRPGTAPVASTDEESRRPPISSSVDFATASEDLNRAGYQIRSCCSPEMGIPMAPMLQESYPYLMGAYGYRSMLSPCTVAIPCRCVNHLCECDYGNTCQPNQLQGPPRYPALSPYNPHLGPSIQYAPPEVTNQMIPPFPQYAAQRRQQVSPGPIQQQQQQVFKTKPKKSICACSNKKKGPR